MNYNDGLVFYYFNASGTKGGTPAIKAMLNYLQNSCESNVINILDLLSDYGEIPEDLKEQITDKADTDPHYDTRMIQNHQCHIP